MDVHAAWAALACITALIPMLQAFAAEPEPVRADVCVVGGGSGGIGAAVAAARAGAEVILVERQPGLGGTCTNAYVCNWEPGPGDSLAREIHERLRKRNAVGFTSDHNPGRDKGPFGLWFITPGLSYEQTLRRAGVQRDQWHAMVFEPSAFCEVASDMLAETGRCRTLLRTSFVEARTDANRVASIGAQTDCGLTYQIHARVFIDCTGGVGLCRALGCEIMLGPETASRFHEPSAPERPDSTLNAISLCYRIRKSPRPARQAAPKPLPPYPQAAHVHGVPGRDLIVNPLAMLPGRALVDMGYDQALAACQLRVQAHWHWLQGFPTFAGYELDSVAPMLGVRESYRVVGEYVLTQHDLLAGLDKQCHPDIIAIADHPMDVHGAGSRRVSGALKGPYGIPYRCLLPKGMANVLVACRGASFSHIAASSCRLSRTMIALGHAAGLAAAMAAKQGVAVSEIDVADLRTRLGI